MTRSEKYIARVLFRLKLHEADGQKFEDFFVKVMGKSNINFKPVKAFGPIGDMKNDGFDMTTGTYYQVFAPEDVSKDKTIYDAVTKVRKDFYGLKEKWNDVCSIKEFFYVVNDKYKGIPAPIQQELIKLGSENPKIKCDCFAAKQLEDVFYLLDEDDIVDILGFNTSENIDILDYSILNQAIAHIIGNKVFVESPSNLTVPDFNDKIEFNGLSGWVNHWLIFASYQTGHLEEYFMVNSEFAKSELQIRFRELYDECKLLISQDEENYSDKRFLYILQKAAAREEKPYRDAVLVLMSYYFESCDIFEEPLKVNI